MHGRTLWICLVSQWALGQLGFAISAVQKPIGIIGNTVLQSPSSPAVLKEHEREESNHEISSQRGDARKYMEEALATMQDSFFDIFGGTWPNGIDWTCAVMQTHVSASLQALLLGQASAPDRESCAALLSLDNTLNKYFTQMSAFFYNENFFQIRNQAYDDMLWVVLGWLENVKFVEQRASWDTPSAASSAAAWHGVQIIPNAAHRARIFYDLAEPGWDTDLCGGGMTWNPKLGPYKNAITNELFAAASIAMYLYYPGDENNSPFTASGDERVGKPREARHLVNAVKSYKWLKDSGMRASAGLYIDGFHVTGWHRHKNGTIHRGTGKCDDPDKMVYTYNQGVILSASRGLWLATGTESYLNDGHALIEDVIRATGWHNRSRSWQGLGIGGILEDWCDHTTSCSQDAQTFKGIFFHHLTEFCRPLRSSERDFVLTWSTSDGDKTMYQRHLDRCESYRNWVAHNARAAIKTRDDRGIYGSWWGASIFNQPSGDDGDRAKGPDRYGTLPPGTVDWRNLDLNESSTVVPGEIDGYQIRSTETHSGGLSVVRAWWHWEYHYASIT